MPFWAPFAVALLVAVTAWGVGGYEPWATLVLELGALALGGWLFLSAIVRTSREDRRRFLAIRRSQKKGTVQVEILEPASDKSASVSYRPYREPFYWMGYPFRRNGVGILLLVATSWIALSLVPLPPFALALLSPKALAVRSEAEALLGREPGHSPLSVTPFLTFQDLILWIALVLVYVVAHHTVASRRGVRRLSACLVLLGVLSGGYGLAQWLISLGGTGDLAGFQASGSFGNRNHYAFFQEMLLLVGLGWLQMRWQEGPRRAADRVEAQEARAKASMVGLGVAIIALSLLFSLSRSGIAFAAAGVAFLLYLTRRARGTFLALAAALFAVALWIGIGPVVSRFELIPDELAGETGRMTVWRDSLPALGDFWLTGSGASSFQYVYPIYRSFGGRRFYSWAHNDYLQVGIELGLPGLALAAALLVAIARRARTVRRDLLEAGSSLAQLHAGYCAAALAVALHSFTDFGLHLPANAALFGVILAASTGMAPSASQKKKPAEARARLRRAPPAAE